IATRSFGFLFEPRYDSKCLRIALKPTKITHALVKSFLAIVAEWRVTKVVSKPSELHDIRLNSAVSRLERLTEGIRPNRDRFSDLRDFERVRQSVSIEVGLVPREDLCLSLEAAKTRAVD